ncbi:MAG: putative immunity protein [Sphaerochaeta sp.]|uniref:putative immunity protein n=1 Tax=Sphaerochaeta sp. TaxID=1972642 RepID=UPI003D14589B
MRNPQFIAVHRGGLLKKEDHSALLLWALDCTNHLLERCPFSLDPILEQALEVGYRWTKGDATTGEAMQASRAVHRFARTVEDPAYTLFCRCIGQAVATAHMADHCMGPIWYGQKLFDLCGLPYQQEVQWQAKRLYELCPSLYTVVQEEMRVRHLVK